MPASTKRRNTSSSIRPTKLNTIDRARVLELMADGKNVIRTKWYGDRQIGYIVDKQTSNLYTFSISLLAELRRDHLIHAVADPGTASSSHYETWTPQQQAEVDAKARAAEKIRTEREIIAKRQRYMRWIDKIARANSPAEALKACEEIEEEAKTL